MSTIEQFNQKYYGNQSKGRSREAPYYGAVPVVGEVLSLLDPPLGPTEYLFGVDRDSHCPMIMDSRNPNMGPILVIGEENSGKNEPAKVIASQALEKGVPVHIITTKKHDWTTIQVPQSNIHTVKTGYTASFLSTIVFWKNRKKEYAPMQQLWVIDSFPLIARWLNDSDSRNISRLQSILTEGRKHGVMIVASMHPELYVCDTAFLRPLVSMFAARLFSRSFNQDRVRALGEQSPQDLSTFTPFLEYRFRHVGPGVNGKQRISNPIDFWLPKVS